MAPLKVPPILLTWPVLTAIGLNLIPVIGVLFWGWSVFALVFLYWLENVVIGVRTLASMVAHAAVTRTVESAVGAAGLGAFFSFHYGMFCFVHGVFVVLMFGGEGLYGAGSPFDLPAVAS